MDNELSWRRSLNNWMELHNGNYYNGIGNLSIKVPALLQQVVLDLTFGHGGKLTLHEATFVRRLSKGVMQGLWEKPQKDVSAYTNESFTLPLEEEAMFLVQATTQAEYLLVFSKYQRPHNWSRFFGFPCSTGATVK